MTTNVPAPVFTATGFQSPTQQQILAGVLADLNQAFGGNLNISNLSSPQGQLASSMAAIIGNVYDAFLQMTNNMNPNFTSGRFQDAIAALYFLKRIKSASTVVQCTVTGLSGLTVAVGALAQDEAGNVYTSTSAFTFVNGTASVQFANNAPGPIPCPAGTLTSIFQLVPGWDSITNPDDGVEGNLAETTSAFAARRTATVAANSVNSLASIQGAVLQVPGVLDAFVTENDQATSVTIGGVTLAANSLYVAAVGGQAMAVAQAIFSKKAPGCAYNGNTTQTVTVTEGYAVPFPTYQVTFEIPSSLPILFAVSLANNAQVPSTAATQIQNAIIAAFSGSTNGFTRAGIGATVFASVYYAAVSTLGPWAQIISIQVGSINSPIASFTGSISGTTLTVSSGSGIVAGQTVLDAAGNVLPGTTIVSGSGTSWVVSISQTVASESMAVALANGNNVIVNINQSPTISANNIAVTLV
jgi:hypothetical protein